MSKGKRVKNNKKDGNQRRKQDNETEKKEKSEDGEFKNTPQSDVDILNALFNTEEQHELKNVLNLQDLTDVPLLICTVIHGKFDTLKRLLKEGHQVDTKMSNTTSLMWAVRNKNLNIVDYLISRGADVNLVDNNGDNAILLAIDNNSWYESEIIDLWNMIKDLYTDINYANKSGNTLLHLTMKRQWAIFLELLLETRINVNLVNMKGVTPLMMAGARCNETLVSLLLRAGADVSREDERGCTALCYAIAYVIQKRLEQPNAALELLVNAINTNELGYTTEDYVKRRIDIIVSSPNDSKDSDHVILSVILPIISFFVRHIKSGLEMLLELNIFARLRDAVEKNIDNLNYVSAILSCIFELVRYCECCVGNSLSTITEEKLMEKFVGTGGADSCLWVLLRYGLTPNSGWLVASALMPLFVACTSEGKSRVWLQMHYKAILPFYQQFLEMCVVSFDFTSDEYHMKLMKRRIRFFRTLMQKLQNGENITNQSHLVKKTDSPPIKLYSMLFKDKGDNFEANSSQQPHSHLSTTNKNEYQKSVTLDDYLINQEKQRNESKANNKRMKRKTKAWKAKVAKIRSADVAERASKNELPKDSEKVKDVQTNENNLHENSSGKIVSIKCSGDCTNDGLKQGSPVKHDQLNNEETVKIDLKLEPESSCDGSISEAESDERNLKFKGSPDQNLMTINDDIETSLAPTIGYLSSLFEEIVLRYEQHWQRDRALGYPDFYGNNGEIDSVLTGTREEQVEALSNILMQLEIVYLSRLREKFSEVIAQIMQMAYDRDKRYQRVVEQLYMTLLNHEIRGETTLTESLKKQSYSELIENILPNKAAGEENISFLNPEKYIEMDQYLREREEEYVQQMIYLSKTRSYPSQAEMDEAKRKTEECAYHLVESVEKLLESNSSISSQDDSESEHTFDELFPYSTETTVEESQTFQNPENRREDSENPITKNKSHEPNPNNFFNILSHSKGRRIKTTDESSDTCTITISPQGFNPTSSISMPNNSFWKQTNLIQEQVPPSYMSRWDSAVTNLRNLTNLNVLGCGELRTCPSTARVHFIISSGGNFGDVEIGLDLHGRALAVKRISKQNNTVCKILKAAMNPLLGLRHKHLLHYAVCEYDDTQLIIASPLCEYNMGEYLMYLKCNNTLMSTANGLARQLLIGLRYLHDRSTPIVHGNLKPSNVLIDSQGVLKLAEFGVYRALYQSVRPPKSSVIWFARETYEHYEKSSIMSCTIYSDIQVAGMLMHFIITGGLHPFGIVAEDILDNIVRGKYDLKILGCDLVDLISWMLIYDPTERPNVTQILSHVYFWDSERKWRFLLACAGITQHGSPVPVSLSHLHSCLDVSAARDHIKGDWVSVVKSKFPGLRFPETSFSDTPTGLLRFLRECTEERQLNNRSLGGIDLQNFFIESFPALPLSLFRLLETSEWLKHPVFSPFTAATN